MKAMLSAPSYGANRPPATRVDVEEEDSIESFTDAIGRPFGPWVAADWDKALLRLESSLEVKVTMVRSWTVCKLFERIS